ncbi:MAG: transcriptional regulator, partial [Paramuribaculum sp.]|nr:transcriptional regulator [Paramuribaculum sp.]
MSCRNANVMSHQILREVGIEVFTPMKEMLITIRGKRQRRKLPVIQDLLFVHESKETLDPFVARIPNLQYRYAYGRKARQPTIVNDADMERFIMAIGDSRSVRY